MAVTAYNLPTGYTTATNGAGSSWNYPERALLNDTLTAYVGYSAIGMYYGSLKLYNGAFIGTDLVTGTPSSFPSGTGDTFGGASNLWGATLTPAIVNGVNFGVGLSFYASDKGGGSQYSNYIILTNFGFNIPSDATINGVEIFSKAQNNSAGGGVTRLDLDYVQMRVYYTWNAKAYVVGSSSTAVYVLPPNRPKAIQQKTYRYFVYDYLRNFVGEWLTVQGTPDFKQDINNLQSSMAVTLAQNELTQLSNVATLQTETPDTLVTEADEDLLADISAPAGLGTGTTLDTNLEVDVYGYWGEFVNLTTEADEPILTEDDDFIMAEDGAPQGRPVFTGYISNVEVDLSDASNVTASILSHAQELKNIMLQTQDTAQVSFAAWDGSGSLGTAGGGPDDTAVIYQTFTANANFNMRRITMPARGWLGNVVSVSIQAGTPAAPVGAVLGGASDVVRAAADSGTWNDLNFDFGDVIPLVNGTQYFITITSAGAKTGGNPTYPVAIKTGTGYAGGSAWYANKTGPLTNMSTTSMLFTAWKNGGATTVTFNSYDPGAMVKEIIKFGQLRGSRVTYTADSIDLANTSPSTTMQTNTLDDAIGNALNAAPAGWYFYFDPAYNVVHFHKKPTKVTRYIIKGRNFINGKLKKTIETLINDVYFSGAGTPAVFIHLADTTLKRRGLKKMSDTRYSDTTSMAIVAQSDIDAYNNAIWAGEAEILQAPATTTRAADAPLEDINVGILVGFIGFGSTIDVLKLQVVSRNYKADTAPLSLSYNAPPVSKRVEDIKRALEQDDMANNPTAPTEL